MCVGCILAGLTFLVEEKLYLAELTLLLGEKL
jgi:hypothetical protein